MTERRMVWEGFLSVELPAGWQCEEDQGVISFYHPDGVGVVQVSFARGHEQAELDEWSQSFADDQRLGKIEPVKTSVGGVPARQFEALSHDEEPLLWRVWHCGFGGRVATVSYVCAAEDREAERHAVERLIASIQWLC